MKYEISWDKPEAPSRLPDNEIHIWKSSLDVQEKKMAELSKILSPDEIERAGRFHFDRDKRRFIAGRGMLREILARYIDKKSEDIKFTYTSRGKPQIDDGAEAGRISFSLSHSHELVLYAFTRDHPIGVDVERARSIEDVEGLARRFFSEREYRLVNASSGAKKQEMFFTIWTIKEAYLKATGEGLSGLEDIEVSLSPDGVPLELISAGRPGLMKQWEIDSFSPADDYFAAVVSANRTNVTKRFFDAERLLLPFVRGGDVNPPPL